MQRFCVPFSFNIHQCSGLCWCWDKNKPKFKPTLPSGLEEAKKKPCDVFTEKMFNELAPNAVHPYTYEGLCETIDILNKRYDEKIFMMGSIEQQKNEWAAFLGHTTHESAQYTAPRENLPCARTTQIGGGTYCKPCASENSQPIKLISLLTLLILLI